MLGDMSQHGRPTNATRSVPAAATARSLHPSAKRLEHPLGIAALTDIAAGLASVVGPAVPPPAHGEVERSCVLSTATYDAWVVTLGPQAAIAPHDHDGSIGVIAVTSGHLIEFGLDGDGQRRSRLRHLEPGDTTDFGITHRHSLANPELAPATMVQVFSPPLGDDHDH